MPQATNQKDMVKAPPKRHWASVRSDWQVKEVSTRDYTTIAPPTKKSKKKKRSNHVRPRPGTRTDEFHQLVEAMLAEEQRENPDPDNVSFPVEEEPLLSDDQGNSDGRKDHLGVRDGLHKANGEGGPGLVNATVVGMIGHLRCSLHSRFRLGKRMRVKSPGDGCRLRGPSILSTVVSSPSCVQGAWCSVRRN
ncbi:hypothetical protein J3459_012115 [Metarhizium acridum]|uniref:uncharacterized protein n=1 Tax=Metarhizium acridum TaxID=92637 RepID=UPI001C6CADE3|nr:hypothetical protein J3458_009487 [Metarhizium acridum]KAG8418717.1 hypothetical protein J3459_012115 [Metarhizium acridum]